MRYISLPTVALLGLAAVSALAQAPSIDLETGARAGHEIGIGDSLPRSDKASNTDSANSRSTIAPTLPASTIGENGASRDYLINARASLVAGRTGQAQQALEMAETRALDRSVAQSDITKASESAFVARVAAARRALGNGDKAQAIDLIDRALAG